MPGEQKRSVREDRDLSEESLPLSRPGVHLDRTVAVFDDGTVVGGAHSDPFEMIVPGAALAVVDPRIRFRRR